MVNSSNFKFPTLLKGSYGVPDVRKSAAAVMSSTIGRSIFRRMLAILAHLRPSYAILVPTCRQEVPNFTPRSPKRAQLLAKITQNSPQEPPTRPPKTPKCGQNAIVMLIFTCRPFLPKSAPTPFKIAKMAPQLASRWRSGAQLGPSWRHLGSILAPSWPTWRHLGPSWRQDAPQ